MFECSESMVGALAERCTMLDVEPRRVRRVAQTFAGQPPGPPEVRLCTAASRLLDSTGVAVSVGAGDDHFNGGLQTVCATDGAQPGEILQFDLGEGPSYTACQTGQPVQVTDLDQDQTWPVFAKAATASGFRAVVSLPLSAGSGSLGALTLYQDVAGELGSERYADALAVAQFSLNLLIALQTRHPTDELDQVFTDGMIHRAHICQASGMASVQLGIPVDAALSVLRAHAFAQACSLTAVANQVIEHRLTLDPLQD